MVRRLPPLNALRAFEAAGRHENFSRAAEELGVSHSAVSRHVRGLEDRLGTRLFQDAAPGVSLTAEGQAYLARITPALDDIAEATEVMGEAPVGRVVINAEPLFAQRVIAPRLAGFLTAFPDIEVQLVASHIVADVDRYEADLAVRFSHAGDLDRPSDLLSAAPLFVYASPQVAASVQTVGQILAERRFQDRPPEIWLDWARAAGVDPSGLSIPNWRLRAMLAADVVRGGVGVYLGSSECVDDMCRRGELRRLSDVHVSLGAFRLVAQSAGRILKPQRLVRDWLLDVTAPYRKPGFWDISQPIG